MNLATESTWTEISDKANKRLIAIKKRQGNRKRIFCVDISPPHFNSRVRICKSLWSPVFDSAQAGDRFLGTLNGLHLRAQAYVHRYTIVTCTLYNVHCTSKLTNTVTKVVFDFGYLKVARGDSLDFEILGGVAGKLQHLSRQILQNCRAEQENILYSSKRWL
jgi:hypothetical protein